MVEQCCFVTAVLNHSNKKNTHSLSRDYKRYFMVSSSFGMCFAEVARWQVGRCSCRFNDRSISLAHA